VEIRNRKVKPDRGLWNALKVPLLFVLAVLGERYEIGRRHLKEALGVDPATQLGRLRKWRYIEGRPVTLDHRPAFAYRLTDKGKGWLRTMLGPYSAYYSSETNKRLKRVLGYIRALQDSDALEKALELLVQANEMREKYGDGPGGIPWLGGKV
jgi:DNA-binding PadR family transcriptional regulator